MHRLWDRLTAHARPYELKRGIYDSYGGHPELPRFVLIMTLKNGSVVDDESGSSKCSQVATIVTSIASNACKRALENHDSDEIAISFMFKRFTRTKQDGPLCWCGHSDIISIWFDKVFWPHLCISVKVSIITFWFGYVVIPYLSIGKYFDHRTFSSF